MRARPCRGRGRRPGGAGLPRRGGALARPPDLVAGGRRGHRRPGPGESGLGRLGAGGGPRRGERGLPCRGRPGTRRRTRPLAGPAHGAGAHEHRGGGRTARTGRVRPAPLLRGGALAPAPQGPGHRIRLRARHLLPGGAGAARGADRRHRAHRAGPLDPHHHPVAGPRPGRTDHVRRRVHRLRPAGAAAGTRRCAGCDPGRGDRCRRGGTRLRLSRGGCRGRPHAGPVDPGQPLPELVRALGAAGRAGPGAGRGGDRAAGRGNSRRTAGVGDRARPVRGHGDPHPARRSALGRPGGGQQPPGLPDRPRRPRSQCLHGGGAGDGRSRVRTGRTRARPGLDPGPGPAPRALEPRLRPHRDPGPAGPGAHRATGGTGPGRRRFGPPGGRRAAGRGGRGGRARGPVRAADRRDPRPRHARLRGGHGGPPAQQPDAFLHRPAGRGVDGPAPPYRPGRQLLPAPALDARLRARAGRGRGGLAGAGSAAPGKGVQQAAHRRGHRPDGRSEAGDPVAARRGTGRPGPGRGRETG